MKKKILLGIILVLAVMCLFAVTASAVEIDGVHYTLNGGENPTAEVSTDNQTATTEIVKIPSTIDYEGVTYKVTSIASSAFRGNRTMKELRILSEHITTIPSAMIADTYDGALAKIYIDFAKITSIGGAGLNPSNQTNGNSPMRNLFYYYDAKAFVENGTDVIITCPDFSNCTSIGDAAFQGAKFEKLIIPSTLPLNNQTFRSTSIKELYIYGEARTSLPYYGFDDCKDLEKVFVYSKNLLSINGSTITGCTKLKEIHIDLSKCQTIKSTSFMFSTRYDNGNTITQWYNLDGEKIVDLSSVKNIEGTAFASTNLGSAKIVWPKALESLGDQALRRCNINQPLYINPAEGKTIAVPYWCMNGNGFTFAYLGKGVTSVSARFEAECIVVCEADSIAFTDGTVFNASGSKLYCKAYTGTDLSTKSNVTVYNITGATATTYGACGIKATVTFADNSTKSFDDYVSHNYKGVADPDVCPVGSLIINTCAGCKASFTEQLENYNGGTHVFDRNNGATVVDVIFGTESYFGEGVIVVKCAHCDAQANDEQKVGALFIADGYSIPENDTTDCISHTIRVNHSNIKLYEDLTGDKINYGIVAGVKDSAQNPIKIEDGKIAVENYAVFADMTGTEYTKLVIKITGLEKGVGISCNAYVVFNADPTKIYYLCDNKVSTEAVIKSL